MRKNAERWLSYVLDVSEIVQVYNYLIELIECIPSLPGKE